MLSYLGVTIDELVRTFEDSLTYTGDRAGRVYAAAYAAEDQAPSIPLKALSPGQTLKLASDEQDDEWDELDDDEEAMIDVFIDEDGRLHSLAESLFYAGEALVGFLTDYIITDEIDRDWLSLDLARGALLGLRISLPVFEEIPEVTCAYKFKIDRDPKTGAPVFVTARVLDQGPVLPDLITRTPTSYEALVSDETDLDDLFEVSGIPEAEHFALEDAMSDAVMHLSDEKCGIAFDVKKFRGDIMRLAARHRMHVVPKETH